MKTMNENAFKEYFPSETLAEKFLRRPDIDKDADIVRILNAGDSLFELKYGEKQIERIAKLMFQHGTDESKYEYGEESDGTKRLIELLDVILHDDEEKVFRRDLFVNCNCKG